LKGKYTLNGYPGKYFKRQSFGKYCSESTIGLPMFQQTMTIKKTKTREMINQILCDDC
jgi:hypothetical protein